MTADAKKRRGAYYTPEDAVAALVRWAVHKPSDRLLDPSCGDGRFLALHPRSIGVERDVDASREARLRAPKATVHVAEFFTWASETPERFDCAAGNPPFIRYQTFAGDTRTRALEYCASQGVEFSALTSSWAPFLVTAASLLKQGGRMAFVVPAEIGHAPYATPLLEFLVSRFEKIQLIAVKERIFPELSEDVWLLYADGYGRPGQGFLLTTMRRFAYRPNPPRAGIKVGLHDWRTWNRRLRSFLLPQRILERYAELAADSHAKRLGGIAKVGIGYVTGANEFFHLRPSAAEEHHIPADCLHVAVRNGRVLTGTAITASQVGRWIDADDPVLLLRLDARERVPNAVRRYLDSEAGIQARQTYKCRNREPWYAVPDVHVPDAFLSYMSGTGPALVANQAGCVGTNSVHTVRMRNGTAVSELVAMWNSPLRELSCEIEGHPLGGGMLKLEPREASRIVVGHPASWAQSDAKAVEEGLDTLRSWRHIGQ